MSKDATQSKTVVPFKPPDLKDFLVWPKETDEQRWSREAQAEVDALTPTLKDYEAD